MVDIGQNIVHQGRGPYLYLRRNCLFEAIMASNLNHKSLCLLLFSLVHIVHRDITEKGIAGLKEYVNPRRLNWQSV